MFLPFITGTCLISVDKGSAGELLNNLAEKQIEFKIVDNTDNDGTLFMLRIPLISVRRLKDSAPEGTSFGGPEGLPGIIYRHRKRWGCAVGALLFAGIVAFSGTRIWSVQVTGNKEVQSGEIREILADMDCGVGDRIKSIDFDQLCNDFLLRCKKVAWISVNMVGTHANVEVREILPGAEVDDGVLYNVVAAEDGQIDRVASVEGKPVVAIGDTVRAGELLISGIIDYRENLVRCESAKGEVFARVNRHFTVNIPCKNTETVKTGRKTAKNALTFFKFKVNLFVNSGNQYENYDTIYSESQVSIFGSSPLPVWIARTCYYETADIQRTLTEAQAKTLADLEYSRLLRDQLQNAQLLSSDISRSFDGESYTIDASLYCLADIAKRVPIQENSENTPTENN